MTREDFCKLHTSFHGEEITDLKQITFQNFSGEELFEFVDFVLRCVNNRINPEQICYYEQDNTTAMNCKHCGKAKCLHSEPK